MGRRNLFRIGSLWGLLALFSVAAEAQTQTQNPVPPGRVQFSDTNGAPLSGGYLYMYVPGGTTPKSTYQDPYGAAQNVQPIILDALGSAAIWGTGLYRQVLFDQYGTQIWDSLTGAAPLSTSGGGGGGGTTVGGLFPITNYGAKCDGATNDITAMNTAIAAAVAAGGGQVQVPATPSGSNGCVMGSTVSVTTSNVYITGVGAGASKLYFTSVNTDDLLFGGSYTTPISNVGVRNLTLANGTKNNADTVDLFGVQNALVENVNITGAWDGIDLNFATNSTVQNVNATFAVGSTGFGIRYYGPTSPAHASSDVFLSNINLNMSGSTASGLLWDGDAGNLWVGHLYISNDHGYGVLVENTATSSTLFPTNGYFYDLEVSGNYSEAFRATSGQYMTLTGGILNAQNDTTAADKVLDVVYDSTAVSKGWTINGMQVMSGPGGLIFLNAKQSSVQGSKVVDGGRTSSNAYPALEIGANADDVFVAGNNLGFTAGQTGTSNYSVQVDASATRVFVGANDFRLNSGTGTFNNLAGSGLTIAGEGIDYAGNPLPLTATSLAGSGGANTLTLANPNTASGTVAGLTLSTGTANANIQITQTDGGTPTAKIATGAGDTGGLNIQPSAGNLFLNGQSQFPTAKYFTLANGFVQVTSIVAGGTAVGNFVADKWLKVLDGSGTVYVVPAFLGCGC